MSRVANRIISALSIPKDDVYEISPFVVAVKPIWQGVIQQWLDTNGQKWYKNWFSKGYMASRVFTGSAPSDHTWCLHRGFLTSAPATLAQQSVRFKSLGLGRLGSNGSNFTATVKGVFAASTAGRYSDSAPNAVLAEGLSISGVQKQFCGLPFGPNYDIDVPMRPNNTVAASGKEAGSYVVSGTCTPAGLGMPLLNMLLIEGPSTFDYGEVCSMYEFFLVMNNTIRQDMLAASVREPGLKLRADSVELENDPTGGLGYLRMSAKSSVNPFDFIPSFRPYAESIFESDGTVEGVSMSSIRDTWSKESVFVGGFAGNADVRTSFPVGVVDDDDAEAIAVADLKALLVTVKSSDAISIAATKSDGTALNAEVTVALADVVIKRQSVRGTPVTLVIDAKKAPAGDTDAIAATYANLIAAKSAVSVVGDAQKELRRHGQRDQVGYSALIAAAKLMSYQERVIASTLLIPGTVYDNTTMALLSK